VVSVRYMHIRDAMSAKDVMPCSPLLFVRETAYPAPQLIFLARNLAELLYFATMFISLVCGGSERSIGQSAILSGLPRH
jgi:hypothetical protein